MKRLIAWTLLIVGGLIGVVWYFDVNKAGEDWSDVLSDPLGAIKDVITRGVLIMRGKVEQALQQAGGSADPKVIAAGLIAQEEGFVGHVYADPPGQTETYSIGYGHQLVDGDGFNQDSTISQSDAFALLVADLDSFAAFVDSHVTAELTPNERAALYSFCYNIGEGGFASSTMLKDINSGDLGSASGEFDRWIYAGGKVSPALQSRRNDEQALFSTDLTEES